MPKLCAFGCAPSGVPMHRFPNAAKLPERLKAWVNLVGGKLETASDYAYYQTKLVCDIHFTARDRNRNNRLNALAIPSLHLLGTSAMTLDISLVSQPSDLQTTNTETSAREPVISFVNPASQLHATNTEHSYHQFPHPVKNLDRFKAWVQIVGGKLDNPADYELYRKRVICDIHFTDKDRNRNNRLNFLAVPSLYIPGNVMHSFPNPNKFSERFRAWVDLVGSNLEQLTDNDIYKKKRICDIHFTDEHRNRFKRLNALAMPTLYLPAESHCITATAGQSEAHLTFSHPFTSTSLPSTSTPEIINDVTETTNDDETLSDENSIAEVIISTTSDTTKTDPENENSTHSNLAAYWKSATGEEQHDDQPGSNHPALSDADDDAGSSDDDNIQEPPPPPQLNLHTAQMCRVCLALDVKMFDLRDTELKTMFQMTTGITFEENKGSKLGSLICWECAGRLHAASTFIRKALFSESLLKGLINKGEQIQKQYFETVKEEADNLIPPKTLTVTEIVHIVEIEDKNNMTQLVQSLDDDEPSLSENDETGENIMYEIKELIIDENSKMDVEGDKDVPIETVIEDDPKFSYAEDQNITKILKANPLDSTSSIEETINSGYSHPLLDIGHTSLRSDSTSPREDFNDQISKTFIKTYSKSKIQPKQNIELKRSKAAVSHDHIYYLKGDSEDGNKKKKIKII